MLVFEERKKPEYPERNLSEQSREPTNSTHLWRRVRKWDGGRCHHCAIPAPLSKDGALFWDPRAPMIWDNFPIFKTNCTSLTKYIRAGPHSSRWISSGYYQAAWSIVRVRDYLAGFLQRWQRMRTRHLYQLYVGADCRALKRVGLSKNVWH